MSAERNNLEPPVLLFIDGVWCRGEEGVRDVINPATERPMGAVAAANDAQIDAAIAAAEATFGEWSAKSAFERGAIIIRAANLIRDRIERIAQLLTLEQGKTLVESRGELTRAVETFLWNGEEAPRIEGAVVTGRTPGSTRRRLVAPLGVVAAFTAWNFPAVLASRKLGAALAAGCTVVLKAAEEAPYTAAAIVACLDEAGLPKGVVNLIFGDPPRVAKRLLASPAVRKVTFTGSTRVGKEFATLAASNIKRCTFELGGHAPVILCADGNVDATVAATIPFKFTSAGQSCIAPSRFYIHRSCYQEFVDKFTIIAKGLKIGDGLEPDTKMGPVANPRRLQAMNRYTEDARQKGATTLCGGERLAREGFFWQPTVLADVPDTAVVMNEEPFGPVAPMAVFDDLDEAIQRANRLPYGFAAYGFTADLRTAERLAHRLEAGNIGINQMCPSLPDMPIGGLKDSGYGYEGGREGIEAFLHFKLVSTTY